MCKQINFDNLTYKFSSPNLSPLLILKSNRRSPKDLEQMKQKQEIQNIEQKIK